MIFSKLFGTKKEEISEFERMQNYCYGKTKNNSSINIDKKNELNVNKIINENNSFIINDGNYIITGSATTEKSKVIKKIVEQERNKHPLIIFDGNGNKGEDSIYSFLKTYKNYNDKNIIVIDLLNKDNSDKYNPFINIDESLLKSMISIILEKVPEMKSNEFKVKRVIGYIYKKMQENNIEVNLKNLITYTNIDNLGELLAYSSKNIFDDKFITDSLECFSDLNYLLEEIYSQASKIFDGNISMKEIMDSNSIVLFLLDNINKDISDIILKLALLDLKNYIPQSYEKKKIVIYDEVITETSGNILELLKRGNSANLISVISCQSIKSIEYLENTESGLIQTVENVDNYMVFRQNSDDNSLFWANMIGKRDTMVTSFSMTGDSRKMLFERSQINNANDNDESRINVNYEEKYIYNPIVFKSLKPQEYIYYYKQNNKYGKAFIR